ncbi:HEPN domain protein [Clostridium homopropionicum DSM 5847]|uniref:HEPN domain protein n=1 Tax=Clostridium homopropionicum DSM 5847 TaxID=1121318 RepID=A0A0L6ZEH2_9CLOT|nr:HEPN domain-containing protein [Clostridium homopropionicum]KOA21347.1 HEPN domain protein [Clostridium homopropionicum DSM 5847]SFG97993.1 HEPN domain-containing protein [Clostridium homopropionicum]
MVDTLRYKEWIEKAERDIKSAKILKEHDCGNDVVAFHCQQSVEKSLKAYLISKGEGIVSGHSLIYLCKLSEKHNSEFKKYIKDCGFLNQYYIETRYPADNPLIVSDYEAEECIDIAEKVCKTVIDLIYN